MQAILNLQIMRNFHFGSASCLSFFFGALFFDQWDGCSIFVRVLSVQYFDCWWAEEQILHYKSTEAILPVLHGR